MNAPLASSRFSKTERTHILERGGSGFGSPKRRSLHEIYRVIRASVHTISPIFKRFRIDYTTTVAKRLHGTNQISTTIRRALSPDSEIADILAPHGQLLSREPRRDTEDIPYVVTEVILNGKHSTEWKTG